MKLELYLAYCLASFAVVIVPGPSVSVIIANSLRHGARAGLLNVAGTQAGLALILAILLAGLSALVQTMSLWFGWLRLAGAAYLIWLGLKLLRSKGEIASQASRRRPARGYFLQGLLVILSNPKALLFFGAFIPQFVDPNGDYVGEVLLLGVTFMAIAAVCDGAYALAAGRAGSWLVRSRVRLVERLSGLLLVGGGLWLALARRSV